MERNRNVTHELTAEIPGPDGILQPMIGRMLVVGRMDRDEKRDHLLAQLGKGAVVVDTNTDTGYEIRWTA